MIILGIDPSIVETGFCVLHKGNILDIGTIKTRSSDSLEKRLSEIQVDIATLCTQYLPVFLAIETQYIDRTKISNSVLKTVESKGVIEGTFLTTRKGGRIIQIHPMGVKSFLGMKGRIKRDDAKKTALWYVQNRYPTLNIKNHNIADAIIISLLAESQI